MSILRSISEGRERERRRGEGHTGKRECKWKSGVM